MIKRNHSLMTPASQIVERLGGFQVVADLLGITPNAVQRWTYPVDPSGAKGDKVKGLGDRVPMRHWAALVAKSAGKVKLAELMTDDVAEIVKVAAKPRARARRAA